MTSLMLMWSVTPSSLIHFSSLVSLWPLRGLFCASGEKLKNRTVNILNVLGFGLSKEAHSVETTKVAKNYLRSLSGDSLLLEQLLEQLLKIICLKHK